MFENESEAQRQNREAIADENTRRAAELRERATSRHQHAQGEREAAHKIAVHQQGTLALQSLKSAQLFKVECEEKLQRAITAEQAAQQRLDQAILEGFHDETASLIEKQEAEKQAKEVAQKEHSEKVRAEAICEQDRRQRGTNPEEFAAAERVRNSSPKTRLCPACRTTIQLVAGELPEEHTYTARDSQPPYLLERRTCHPYGIDSPKPGLATRVAAPFA
jgi:hypothetical protein